MLSLILSLLFNSLERQSQIRLRRRRHLLKPPIRPARRPGLCCRGSGGKLKGIRVSLGGFRISK